MFVKYTTGSVKQVFNDKGECLEQSFTAGDDVTIEGLADAGVMSEAYHPFYMEQPGGWGN